MSTLVNPQSPLQLRLFHYLESRLRPREGWLSFALLLTAVITMTRAVVEAEWIDQLGHLIPIAIIATGVTTLLAKQRTPLWRALPILLAWGATIGTLGVARLLPPPSVLFMGWPAIQTHARQNAALTLDRAIGWWRALSGGNSSSDTIAFALLVTVLIWVTASYLTWATYRQQRPLAALCIAAMGLAVNSYFSQKALLGMVIFVAVAVALVAYMRLISLESRWVENEIDYSAEIRIDLLWSVAFVGIILAAISSVIPSISIRAIANRVADSAIVQSVEDTLERAFDGVNVENSADGASANGVAGNAAQPVRGSVLPRSYLLDTPPRLLETVVMTATVSGDPAALIRATHWRGISYDVYNGRGWSLSDERRAIVVADEPIISSPASATSQLVTTNHWLNGTRSSRYSPGIPNQFDSDTIAYWRGSEDFSRAHGSPSIYQVRSQVSIASAAELNAVTTEEIPDLIKARYTELPDSVPDRVHALAQQIVADAATPYQQARAIEAFVRQYKYSLDIDAPPPDVDLVDYFLFDSQIGYCDYYATSMTVLARSVGLPARMAAGYYVSPSSTPGERQMRELDGHSWSEVYLGEYGWVEFEPTASFEGDDSAEFTPLPDTETPPIPESDSPFNLANNKPFTLPLIGAAILMLALLTRFARPRPDSLAARQTRLRLYAERLGLGDTSSLTPTEFSLLLDNALENFSNEARFGRFRIFNRVKRLRAEIADTLTVWIDESYAGNSAELPPARILRGRFDWLFLAMRR